MIESQADEGASQDKEDQAPGESDAPRGLLQIARQHHQQSLTGQHRHPIESVTDADEKGLLLLVKSQHVESIRRDVMRSGAEGHQPEEGQGTPREEIPRQGESHTRHTRSDQQLHGIDPPTFRAKQKNKKTQKGIDNKEEIEQAGVERYVGVRHLHAFIHNDRKCHDNDIG